MTTRILLFGDIPGIPQILRYVPVKNVIGIVGASIRPQYFSQLKSLSVELSVPFLIQPKWRSKEYEKFIKLVSDLAPDVFWINSYSMILKKDLLGLAKVGGLNIHTALLPRNRGCNPTQWAILNGDSETGVTLHEVTNGVDEGPIVDQYKVPIFFDDTWCDVRGRLAQAKQKLIEKNLSSILSRSWTAQAQSESHATVGHRREPQDGQFFWTEPIIQIYNKVRALLPPLPPAFFVKSDGGKFEMNTFLTICQVTALKYDSSAREEMCMQSEKVGLRCLRKGDSTLFCKFSIKTQNIFFHEPLLMKSEADHPDLIDRFMAQHSDQIVFVIEEIENSRAIGACRFTNLNWNHRSAELQIYIIEEGSYGVNCEFDILRMLCTFGFTELKLHRICHQILSSQTEKIQAYERCGFLHEGVLKDAAFINGSWLDVNIMGLIKIDE